MHLDLDPIKRAEKIALDPDVAFDGVLVAPLDWCERSFGVVLCRVSQESSMLEALGKLIRLAWLNLLCVQIAVMSLQVRALNLGLERLQQWAQLSHRCDRACVSRLHPRLAILLCAHARLGFRSLAVRRPEDERHALVPSSFDSRHADQYGEPAPRFRAIVLSSRLYLSRATSGTFGLGEPGAYLRRQRTLSPRASLCGAVRQRCHRSHPMRHHGDPPVQWSARSRAVS